MKSKPDSELLRLASKEADVSTLCWNPLLDNSDAFRLMVKLGLTLHFYEDQETTLISVSNVKDPEGYDVIVKWEGDKMKATRRAITLMAAKLGEELESDL